MMSMPPMGMMNTMPQMSPNFLPQDFQGMSMPARPSPRYGYGHSLVVDVPVVVVAIVVIIILVAYFVFFVVWNQPCQQSMNEFPRPLTLTGDLHYCVIMLWITNLVDINSSTTTLVLQHNTTNFKRKLEVHHYKMHKGP